MAQFFKPQKKQISNKSQRFTVDSMNHEGLGVTRHQGKVMFIEGALTGEQVEAKPLTVKSKFAKYSTLKVIEKNVGRVNAFCAHYGQCGGCQLQHATLDLQLLEKQNAVSKLFEKFAKVSSLEWQLPLVSPAMHYRRSGRIAVIYDKNKAEFLVGFRKKRSKQIINIDACQVMVAPFLPVFESVRNLLPKMKNGRAISHLQVCSVDSGDYLIVRHTKKLCDQDRELLKSLCDTHNWLLVLEHDTGCFSESELPYYQFLSLDLKFSFNFDNFIQVNPSVNLAMVQQALDWLALEQEDSVLDLFCGIGNFTLPMAKHAGYVVGVEGVNSAIAMAKKNASLNQLDNTDFYCQDLSQNIQSEDWFNRQYSVLLLDPSRMGAYEILSQLKLKQFNRILYVACDPVTMARDSEIIIKAGFKISKIGLMNMFPHTSHIETMALFEKEK